MAPAAVGGVAAVGRLLRRSFFLRCGGGGSEMSGGAGALASLAGAPASAPSSAAANNATPDAPAATDAAGPGAGGMGADIERLSLGGAGAWTALIDPGAVSEAGVGKPVASALRPKICQLPLGASAAKEAGSMA